jgi:DNA-binding transcriptional LysR family regulator
MRFNKLDLNLLVVLDALLTERNISRAAEKVHLSQSTLSHSLARLREYFEDELLVQVGRKMELTPRAEALRDPVRDVLVRIGMTIAVEPEFDPAQSDREFSVFVSDYSMEVLMPHLLALAHEQRSKVRFRFLPQTAKPHRALERGEADMLLIPSGYCSPDHPTETLFQEHFHCVVWSESQLAGGELTIERYQEAGHVVMQPTDSEQPAFESWFVQRYGVSRRIDVTTYTFTSLPALVVGTELIATVHARLARRAAKSLPLTLFAPPLPMPAMEQAIQWHKYRTNDPGLVWLRFLLKHAALRMDTPHEATRPQPGSLQASARGEP